MTDGWYCDSLWSVFRSSATVTEKEKKLGCFDTVLWLVHTLTILTYPRLLNRSNIPQDYNISDSVGRDSNEFQFVVRPVKCTALLSVAADVECPRRRIDWDIHSHSKHVDANAYQTCSAKRTCSAYFSEKKYTKNSSDDSSSKNI